VCERARKSESSWEEGEGKKREGGFLKERGRRGSHGTHTAWCGAPADDPQH
jgi:hypothetical protein